MYELKKKFGKVFTSKFVGTGPFSYEKKNYRAAVSQWLRNIAVQGKLYLLHSENNSPHETYTLITLIVHFYYFVL